MHANLKVVVINFTGTVGKTTIAMNLLSPRMNGAPIFAIESINKIAEGIGLDVEKFRGEEFRELLRKVVIQDYAIIDVGASNVEDFMANLESFDSAHEEIDFFIVPVTSGTKEQEETIAMIKSLSAIGIPASKIRVIFNRVQRDVYSEFAMILNFHSAYPIFTLNLKCVIYENVLFDALSINKLSFEGLMADSTDYKTLLKNKEADPEDRAHWSDMFGLKLLCNGVNKKLDVVYDNLFL